MIYTNCTSVVFLPFRRLGRFSHRLSRQRRYLLCRLAFHSLRDSILHLPSFFLAYHQALPVLLTVSALLKSDLFYTSFYKTVTSWLTPRRSRLGNYRGSCRGQPRFFFRSPSRPCFSLNVSHASTVAPR